MQTGENKSWGCIQVVPKPPGSKCGPTLRTSEYSTILVVLSSATDAESTDADPAGDPISFSTTIYTPLDTVLHALIRSSAFKPVIHFEFVQRASADRTEGLDEIMETVSNSVSDVSNVLYERGY